MYRLFRFIVFALAAIVVGCSVDPEPTPIIPPVTIEPPEDINGPTDLALWNALDRKVMGYQYITLKDGEVVTQRSGGLAKNEFDGREEMTLDHQMHIASISKFITTVAVLQLLEKHEIGINESIAPFLPKEWEKGEGIEDISFLNLMSHTARLNKVGLQNYNSNRYDSLKAFIRQGSSADSSMRYSNTHHALFRVILPIMVDSLTNDTDVESDQFTMDEYERIVRDNLLEPLNIEARLINNGPERTLAYNGPFDTGRGNGDILDFRHVSGGYGWHISSRDLSVLWSKVWYSEEVISSKSRDLLSTYFIGLYNTRFSPQQSYLTKLGVWGWSSQGKYNKSVAVHFPEGYDLIIFVNSQIESITELAWSMHTHIISGEGA